MYIDSLLANLGFQKCVSVYTMPKTAARGIHGRYQYDVIMYLSSVLVNNKGADQPAHPHSLISALAFRSFESIISRLSVIKETGLSLALSKTPKTGLFCVEALYYSRSLLLFLFPAAYSFGCFKKL